MIPSNSACIPISIFRRILPSSRCLLSLLCALIATGSYGADASPAAIKTNWQQAGWGGGGFYFAAVYHPTQDGVIYMAGDVNGVYKTEDHGRHWRIINNGIASYAVYSLAVSQSEPQTVFAATEDGLSKSTDAGEHWRTLPQTGRKELRITGGRKLSIRAIAVDPSDGRIVYAASPSGKVYKSSDGGETWAVSYEKKPVAEESGALRVQFGKINGEYYGDLALPVAIPAGVNAADCNGIGFSVKGDGSLPKDCFMVLKTSGGTAFRSKNLNAMFKETAWHEMLLKAEDFAVDSDYLKKHPEAASATFSDKNWPDITRLDIACSGNLPNEASVGLFAKFFFTLNHVSSAKNGMVTFRDFVQDQAAQTFGNIHLGAPPSGTIYSVTVSAVNPSHVIAATQDSGLVLSRNAGRTWTRLATPARAASATFDPANPDLIYGAFFKNGVMKSTDGGKRWDKLSKDISGNVEVIEVAVSPGNPSDLYAIGSVDYNGACYVSNNGGESWTKSNKIKVDTKANPTLDGISGRMASMSAARNITLNPRNPKEIFIAANWRPCMSLDGGVTWEERDAGTDISCITDIRFHQGKTYVTAMDEGTLVSENDGGQWRQLWPLKHTPGLSGHDWRVAIDEVNGSTRIISTVTPWYKVPTCVVRSEDGGKTFQSVQTGLPDYTIRPNTMWGQGHPRALAVDPNNPQIIYLGIDGDAANGKSGGGLFKSTDGGASWSQLPNQPASRRMFFALAVDPTDSKRLFWGACGTGGGVHRSDDGGNSWQQVFPTENFIWNLHITTDGTIYCSGQHLWRSTDHGTTWTQVTRFAEKRSIVGIEVHPTDPKTMWISATTWNTKPDGAIYKTTDGGTTWQNITGDIPYVKPTLLRFNPATSDLWAGGVGLYKIKQ
ncbi:MAG: hypothetical protein NTX35_15240 [Verrucomicrobia bacterium]|nr:hypothetical protein [Verrucomicrobiota bacterium]